MRITGPLLPSLLIFVFLMSLVGDPNGLLGKGQLVERPRFYAVQIVSEKGVLNAKDALGAPDGHYAEILPGGELVLLMEKELEVFPVRGWDSGVNLAYSGAIVAKGDTPALLEAWIPIRSASGDERYVWIPIGGDTSGLYFNVLWRGPKHTDKIRITNLGPEVFVPGDFLQEPQSLFVDAIIGGRAIH